MLERFLTHISTLLDTSGNSTYLLAFSGGQDSVCLASLLIRAKVPFEVAHVNFGLRGTESDLDEEFAKNWANDHQVEIYLLHPNTQELADSKGISIQMAAREIRYNFFEKIRSERNLAGIILAHHEDDQIETILLNLLRGTGIEGLYGMADKKGHLIRPLLPFAKEEISNYLLENTISWREDSSNSSDKYKRNRLRHQVIPTLLSVEPDARKNLLTSLSRLKDTGKLFFDLVEKWKKDSIREQGEFSEVEIQSLKNQPGAASLLYFWLRSYGFQPDQTQEIASNLSHFQTGAVFYSKNFELVIDREKLILGPKVDHFEPITLERGINSILIHGNEWQISEENWNGIIDPKPTNALLDLEQLTFPLTIRSWEEGDRFIPLGMNSSKKISDFLIDQKIPLIQKRRIKVLESGGKIAWIIGHRIADWAKCSPSTRICLHFKKS